MKHSPHLPEADLQRLQSLQARLGLRLAARLGQGAEALPHDIAERLRFARERAVAARPVAQAAPAPAVVLHGSGRAAALAGPPSWGWRLVSAVPLLVLLAGLVYIQDHNESQFVNLAADIDSELLADDLPPEAYVDPGFSEFLRLTTARR